MSLLREIQNDIASPSGDVVSVLRKCKILAARLGSEEFAVWVDRELNGYPDSEPPPNYRRLGSNCYANFLSIAWQANGQPVPFGIFPEEFVDSLRQIEFRDGIAKVASFVAGGARIHRPDLIFHIQGKMYPGMNCSGAWIEISAANFDQLISAVKNRILDFVLKIEAENPDAGEAPLNSQPVPREKLQPLVNNFFGTVGSLAQNSQHVSQTTSIGLETQDLRRLIAEFTTHLDELNLGAREKQKAEIQIATLKAQLSDEPDPVIVKQAGLTLRNITEGAIGSLLATAVQPAVWLWVQQTMAKLS
jgi:AbiTii